MLKRLQRGLARRQKRWRQKRLLKSMYREVARFPKHAAAPKHDLNGQLVVSLTSYPDRFETLHLTIKSLLDQAVRPDVVILWIAHGDAARLPAEVLALQECGLTIDYCEDLRNFKKILPTLERFPGAFVVTADDDIFYPDSWLAGLISTYDHQDPTVVCYRAHRMAYADGRLAPYRSWPWEVTDAASALPSRDLMPTGIGGVMYPPGSLAPETTDLELLRRLSPTSDDVWLLFMWQRTGWRVKRVPGARFNWFEWPGTQVTALWSFHNGGKKDEHLADMSDHFGVPGLA